jgi:hypothetical protein
MTKEKKKAPPLPKNISKGHMAFTNAEAGYFGEMIGREEKCRWNFSLNKNYLYKPRNPTLGEKTDREGMYEYYLPPEKHAPPRQRAVESNGDDHETIIDMKRIETLKRRRAEIKQQLHEFHMSMGVDTKTRELALTRLT